MALLHMTLIILINSYLAISMYLNESMQQHQGSSLRTPKLITIIKAIT